MSQLAFRLLIAVPTDEKAMKVYEWSERKELPPDHPRFHSLLFSIDQILPLISLDQSLIWRRQERHRADVGYWTIELFFVLAMLLGWALPLIVATVPTGLIKHH